MIRILVKKIWILADRDLDLQLISYQLLWRGELISKELFFENEEI